MGYGANDGGLEAVEKALFLVTLYTQGKLVLYNEFTLEMKSEANKNHFIYGSAGASSAFFIQQLLLLFLVLGQTIQRWILLTIILLPEVILIGAVVGMYAHKLSGISDPRNTLLLAFIAQLFAVGVATLVDLYILQQPINANNLSTYRVYFFVVDVVCGLLIFILLGWVERLAFKLKAR